MAIGLKGSWKETKGCRFVYRLKELRWNIKYAWQRAWYGWDRRDVFCLNDMFVEKYKDILKDFKENHWGLFNVPYNQRDNSNKLFFNEEETDEIIDTMIYHLEMMNEDYVEKKLYGKNIYDDDYDFKKDFSIDKCRHVAEIVDQNKDLFMKLFSTLFWELWD